MTPADLSRLSTLLDEALDLPLPEREAWLATLEGEAAMLAPTLRNLLCMSASMDTADLLERGPSFELPVTGPAAGDAVGPYRLLSELGIGGMGAVWLAERADGSLKRKVALKLPHLSWAPGLAERFAREREILASLEHPHIARLYDAGVDAQGRPFMALEYVEGQPLDVYCRERALSIPARLRLLLQVAEAVAFAHGRLVLHRDLKPANILVTGEGQVRLLDFGVAKLMQGDRTAETALTQASGRALTLDYASPEQIRGEALGTASDVYSLGVVAFELLAGVRPYRLKRGSAAELEEAITGQDVPLASAMAQDTVAAAALRGDLDAILNKALKKSATERYATIDALAQEWRRHLAGEGVHARPDTLAYRVMRFARRYRMPLLAAAVAGAAFVLAIGFGATAVVIAALLVGLGIAVRQAKRAREQAQIAQQETKRAQVVQNFLVELFSTNSTEQADPLAAKSFTARELLDRGAAHVDEALRNEPQSRMEVLRTLADMYWQIGEEPQAAVIERRRMGLARQVYAATDTRLAKVLLDYAETLANGAGSDEVPQLVAEAQKVMDLAGDSRSEMRAQALVIAADYWRHVSLEQALRTADEAASFLNSHQPDSDRLVMAQMTAARVRIYSGDLDGAVAKARQAVAVTARLKGSDSPWLLQPKQTLGDALSVRLLLEPAEAEVRSELALSTRLNGPEHIKTLTTMARLGAVLIEVGRVAQGDAAHAEVRAVLAGNAQGNSAGARVHIEGLMGKSLLERGRPDLLPPILAADIEDMRRTLPRSGLLAHRLRSLALVQALQGDTAAARQTMAEASGLWRAYAAGTDAPAAQALFALGAAQVETFSGDAAAALAWLESTRQLAPREAIGVPLARARAWLALCRPADASREAVTASQALQALPEGYRPVAMDADAQLMMGQARLQLGDAKAALPQLTAALDLRLRHDDPASVWLADAQIALAECLAASGRRKEARSMLNDAKRIHAQHRALGPYLASALKLAIGAVETA